MVEESLSWQQLFLIGSHFSWNAPTGLWTWRKSSKLKFFKTSAWIAKSENDKCREERRCEVMRNQEIKGPRGGRGWGAKLHFPGGVGLRLHHPSCPSSGPSRSSQECRESRGSLRWWSSGGSDPPDYSGPWLLPPSFLPTKRYNFPARARATWPASVTWLRCWAAEVCYRGNWPDPTTFRGSAEFWEVCRWVPDARLAPGSPWPRLSSGSLSRATLSPPPSLPCRCVFVFLPSPEPALPAGAPVELSPSGGIRLSPRSEALTLTTHTLSRIGNAQCVGGIVLQVEQSIIQVCTHTSPSLASGNKLQFELPQGATIQNL